MGAAEKFKEHPPDAQGTPEAFYEAMEAHAAAARE